MSFAQAFHTLRPSKNGTTAACHTRLHRTKHALKIYIAQCLPRGARRLACGLRIGSSHPIGLVSACWGASEIGSDITDGGIRPKGRMRDCRKGPQNTEAFYRRSQECLLRFKRTRHYVARQFVKKRYISCRRLSWLMMVWLTHAPPSTISAPSRVFCDYSLELYYSKILLNII
jgi:hypothetical protein